MSLGWIKAKPRPDINDQGKRVSCYCGKWQRFLDWTNISFGWICVNILDHKLMSICFKWPIAGMSGSDSVKVFYLGTGFVCSLPSRGQRCDGEAVWVFSISDLWLFHQTVQLFLGHVLHLLPIGWCLEQEKWGNKDWLPRKQWEIN